MGNSNSQQLHLQLENHDKIFGGLHRERSWIAGLGGHHSLGPHHQLQSHGHLIVPLTDAVIQRKMLRNTENGQILQNEGTISQRRRSMRHTDDGPFTLNPNRRTLSDSDLSRKAFDYTPHPDGDQHQSQTQKSVIAISPSKAKIKLRKNKGKAPEPPTSGLEHARDSRDARDSMQRRFVRSNSSLCPRTWEHEFNSLNIIDNRSSRADSRADSRESRSRCNGENADGSTRIHGGHSGTHKPASNRLARPEVGLLRRSAHEKPATGSTKSTTSIVSQRGSGARTPTNSSKTPTKAKSDSASKAAKREISDTPKPAPVKPQFYFSNIDALKKEMPKANGIVTKDKASTKVVSVSKSTTAAKCAHGTEVTGKMATKEMTKPASKDTKPLLSTTADLHPSPQNARNMGKHPPQPARSSLIVTNATNSRITAEQKVTTVAPAKKLPDSLAADSSKDTVRREELLKAQPNQIRQLVVESARSNNSGSLMTNRNSHLRQQMPVNDNVVFKVNPNFGQVPASGAGNPMSFNVPQTASQILDELDATLDNYSALSVGRKSDDSDYCDPDERNLPSPPKAPLPPPPVSTPSAQPSTDVYAPRIPPPKSLEILFRPPSPKEPKSLPQNNLNSVDATSHNGMTSSSVADKPPTPPPIPASWIKSNISRKASISSSSSEDECGVAADPEDVHISVHIRPCLPRRPITLTSAGLTPSRFSPTHAWKSLDPAGSDGDRNSEGHKSLSDCELNFSSSSSSDEDRKEEETPLKAHLSVDSGITSGYSNPHTHWTPKEDLIDTDTESIGGTEPADISSCMFSLPNQARFTLPSMFLSQNSTGGVDSNWSFKSGPNSLQQKSQSFVYLPPPKNGESSIIVRRTDTTGSGGSSRRLTSAGRSANHPSLTMGGPAAVGAGMLSLNVEITPPGNRQTPHAADDPLLEAERLREKEHKWMQKVEEEFRKRRERDRLQLQEQMEQMHKMEQMQQMELVTSLSYGLGLGVTSVRPDPEGGCDQLQVR
ncbi:hypothetical protein BIW11_02091 [Tropilaelaps mercedesae]|uniref:Uncharacterized protein n=1 Tax=Tropilaelaps mercedesae TaxID=418985 RepID=A0A1V9X3D6_9ACAR|nr:hypothetical protein BIW11_02091 [Tropilaelaps mercedesae]